MDCEFSFLQKETLAAQENTHEQALDPVNTYSKPSDLRITDLRIATVVGAPMRCPLIKISTNQGIEGYGKVRDGASKAYGPFSLW